MILAVLSGFLLAVLIVFFGNHFKKAKLMPFVSLVPLAAFIYFLSFLFPVGKGESLLFHYSWIPSVQINLDFKVDGLSLLFSLMITGIGSLVFYYASAYMKHHIHIDRFFVYLSIFMSSMLGLVLSDNIMSLIVFWELTSISSFYLIGFNNEDHESRESAIWAFSLTALGGFFLLVAFVLIGNITGTYNIHELMEQGSTLKSHHLYPLLISFIFIGAFTKSAQFPFHFWLPNAMKAPTPVSAYLHSATMVKAGIYLIARFTPILGNQIYWNNTLMIIGGITLAYAAFHALFRSDLKAILAYSTIASLGMLVFLLGIGTNKALLAVSVFILVHALYKAGLFLTVGTIDYKTGLRDIRQLRGLRHIMKPVAIGAGISALSSAGLPLTFGFIGKDLIYEATLNYGSDLFSWAFTALAFFGNTCLLVAGLMVGFKPFWGEMPKKFERYTPSTRPLWLPIIILGLLAIAFGIFPTLLQNNIISPVARSMNNGTPIHNIQLWHGFTLVILLSILTLFVGFSFYFIRKGMPFQDKNLQKLHHISPQSIMVTFTKQIQQFAFKYTRLLQHGYLRYYLMTIVVFLVVVAGYRLVREVPLSIDWTQLSEIRSYEIVFFIVITLAIIKTIFTPSRLTAIAGLSIVGYCICVIFVFFGAPDLAITQFSIDTLTVVLFVLVLFRLPHFKKYYNAKIEVRDGIVALSFGFLIATIGLQALNYPSEKHISNYFGENSFLEGHGKNVVNVILVDFRGADTMIEIIVLSIAAIGVYGMLKLKVKAPEKE